MKIDAYRADGESVEDFEARAFALLEANFQTPTAGLERLQAEETEVDGFRVVTLVMTLPKGDADAGR